MKKPSSIRSQNNLAQMSIPAAATPELRAVAEQFSAAITPAMLNLIDADDPHDPIAAQFIPRNKELTIHPRETEDPIADHPFTPVKGVVHRYPDRALLKLTLSCPVHCRFCFRRDQIDTPGGTLNGEEIARAVDYIAQRPEIWEVILTGGEPLMLPDRYLANVVAKLNAVPHVRIIRVHTRIPVVDPARVTPGLIAALRGRAPVYVMLHCNHPRELTAAAREACARLVDAGIPMLSQSVLLRGVNDDPETLTKLMRGFLEARVKPHYLHHLDQARGIGHFRVTIEKGRELMRSLRGRISGLAQPSYVLDIPGGYGKVPIGPVYAVPQDDGYAVEDYKGESHNYRDDGDPA